MQLDPLSTWLNGKLVPWHERQSIAASCQEGLAGPKAWLGVPL